MRARVLRLRLRRPWRPRTGTGQGASIQVVLPPVFAPMLLRGLLAVGAALPGVVRAQTINPGALDALTPARPVRPAPPARPTRPASPASAAPASAAPSRAPPAEATPAGPLPARASPAGATAGPSAPTAAGAAAQGTAPAGRPAPVRPGQPRAASAAARPPAVPTVPPAIADIPPAVAVPMSHPPPPPPAAIAADAPGTASPIPGGVRVTFGEGRSDLNPVTEPALRTFARTLKGNEQATVNLVATAAGSPDDASTPRRLALARAMAARSILIAEGIASTRIYVRALGASGPAGPADRVDLVASGPAPAAAPAPGSPDPAPGAAPGPAAGMGSGTAAGAPAPGAPPAAPIRTLSSGAAARSQAAPALPR